MKEMELNIAKYDPLIMFGDTNAKIGIENVLINAAGRESLHKGPKDNGQ